jgi:hypothetical protein
MSDLPYPPGRRGVPATSVSEEKRERPSAETLGLASQYRLLIFDPRFTGGPQGSCLVFRVVTYRSELP